MTNPRRIIGLLVVTAIPFVARFAHQELRAPAGTTEAVLPYVLLSLMCVIVVAILDAPPRTTSVSHVLVNAIETSLLVLGAEATSQLLFPATLPRFAMLLTAALIFVWLVSYGGLNAVALRRAGGARRVVAVVNPTDGAQLLADVDVPELRDHVVVADVITSEDDYGRIAATCHRARATTLVLGPRASVNADVIEQAEVLHSEGLSVRSIESFYDEILDRLPLSSLDRFALMGDIESLHGSYAPVKRAIDIVFATLGLALLVALAPFVLVGNLVANRGPIFFTQERVGLRGEPFRIWKLRTMRPGAVDVSGWTSNDDPRITPFGKLLRRTHVDELPQVVNIFLGELSVVGPRPEQVEYARRLEQSLPFYAARHLVRPGLTGWAQVRYRYAASEEDAWVKLQYDLHYVRHESLETDLRIIWLTIRHLLVDGGR